MGGTSGEREVSLRSGNAIARALEDKGYEVVRVDLNADDDWASVVREARIDSAFLALHGRLGEDGCVQGLCEVLGIPYTGSGVLASALAMDKVKAKELFRQHNVPTPAYYVIVKPRGEGSSLGMTKVTRPSELHDAIVKSLQFDDVALVERYITAREVQVGVLDGRVLGAIEVAPKKGIYDYESKYTPGMTEYFMPARLPPTRYLGVLNLAERAVRALGCTGACRVDLLVTEGENEYVLEVNTLPGMTPTSLLPKIAAAAGFDFEDLCEAILRSASLHAGPRKRESQQQRNSDIEMIAPATPLAKAV
jgi:D-alanine-D-alanine ligase